MALAIVLGLAIGLALGSLGGGGSILAVPVLAHLAGQSVAAATATSLVAVGVSAGVGSVSHARAGQVRWGAAMAFVATGVAGSWVGTEVNHRMDGDVLLLAFSGLVLVAAHRMLTACPSCTRVGEEEAVAADSDPKPLSTLGPSGRVVVTPTAAARVVLAGTAVGFMTGLFGVGGGFVIVPALTLALGLNMPQAIGTSLVVIVGNALVALGFRGIDAVDWAVALPFTATMVVGSLAGSLVAHRLPPRQSLTAFATLLVLVAVANAAAAAHAIWL
ncbi:MAG: sulfite exporter TauE/SafE family protein [Acidimicrobiales bacterium]